ncbi:MAG: UDP-3-O-acyl-N-acetylglucosamine deacetylase [Elusimicrobiota bacterium]|jgi:UDP-3-O-[3-hydroxymyristoyl] N-acetylglucosamine deacetylase|nr:UDP-3-O-acyl-N-acetylglucosamine deacetylase [Elusimicrobiota bacterium]
MQRQTLGGIVTLKGIGLHTGRPCSMTFRPSSQGYISFARTDIKGAQPIAAALESVISTMRGTNLANDTAEVQTVEPVLSAANAFGVTDLIVEMDGPEPPVMDGSALQYALAMQRAGFKPLGGDYPSLSLKEPVEFKDGDIFYKAEPADKTMLSFTFARRHPFAPAARQEFNFELTPENFLKEIAPARTFGFEEELAFLKQHGLAKGGSLENSVIITKQGYLNTPRFETELARHKILDMLGDFNLMRRALGKTRVSCQGGGHKSNIAFAKILLEKQGQ